VNPLFGRTVLVSARHQNLGSSDAKTRDFVVLILLHNDKRRPRFELVSPQLIAIEPYHFANGYGLSWRAAIVKFVKSDNGSASKVRFNGL
jgi:hypothetical protein